MRSTWIEKLNNNKDLPKVEVIHGKMSERWGKGTVVIPAPKEVFDIMSKVPKGKITTINAIRQKIANKHKATIGCPITCGIFAWISAHAAEEIAEKNKVVPMAYWRTLKSDGSLNEKYPGSIDLQTKLLNNEGFTIVRKGKKFFIKDYESYLV